MSSFPTSAAEVCAFVRDTADRGGTLCPGGGGVQQHIGYAPDPEAQSIDLRRLAGIVEYSAADLVVVAQAGVTLASLQKHLADYGQWLPIEVAQPETQTLGGIVATRASSATRAGHGSVRDWLVGLSAVGHKGQEIVAGGKVVKNVSGYDLPKLFCGSWGTLGIITQVAFKLAPLPETSQTILALLSSDRNSEEAIDALLAVVTPVSTHLLNSTAAKQLMGADAAEAQYLVARFDGQSEDVEQHTVLAEAALAAHSLSILRLPSSIGDALAAGIRDYQVRDVELSVRYNILSSQVGAFSRMVEWTANKSAFSAAVVAECRTGIMYCHMNRDSEKSDWAEYYRRFRDKSDRVGGSHVIERMPDEWRARHVPVWSPLLPEFALMKSIKGSFDPAGLFNRGRYTGGL